MSLKKLRFQLFKLKVSYMTLRSLGSLASTYGLGRITRRFQALGLRPSATTSYSTNAGIIDRFPPSEVREPASRNGEMQCAHNFYNFTKPNILLKECRQR